MACRTLPPTLRSVLSLATVMMSTGLAQGQSGGELFEPVEAAWLSLSDAAEIDGPEEALETDRDSFTPSTSTVASGRCLFEAAYSYIDHRDTDDAQSYPEIITRIGLNNRTELRLGWNFEEGGGGSISGGDAGGLPALPGSEEESQMLYGVKHVLTEQNTWIPKSACIIQGVTPTYGPDTATEFQLGYVFGWKFLDDWQLDSSLRYVSTKEEEDHFNQWAPSIVLKVPVAEKWNLHGEYFGVFTDGRAEHLAPQYFSPGVHYLLTPDLEVGARVGWGLSDDAGDFFVNVGFGLQI